MSGVRLQLLVQRDNSSNAGTAEFCGLADARALLQSLSAKLSPSCVDAVGRQRSECERAFGMTCAAAISHAVFKSWPIGGVSQTARQQQDDYDD